MIDFYAWKTPNNDKVAIMLEEVGLPYHLHAVDLRKQKQFSADFLKINPNNKVPAIIDHDGPNHSAITVVESGAILMYLAEKTGQFLPTDPIKRIQAIEWLMFQMSGVGPNFGQAHHFLHFAAERVPYAIERYLNEVKRLYRVMDERLEKEPYFAGEYSIADIAIFPWVHNHDRHRVDLSDYPCLERWHNKVNARLAVQRGLTVLTEMVEPLT